MPLKQLFILCFFYLCFTTVSAQSGQEMVNQLQYVLLVKNPGHPADQYVLKAKGQNLAAEKQIPLKISYTTESKANDKEIIFTVEAVEDTWFNFQGQWLAEGFSYDTSHLYLPGFWYRKNLRSPGKSPSARISKNWIVREDRLSTPLVGVVDLERKQSYSLVRMDKIKSYALSPLQHGEVLLNGPSDMGALGFGEKEGTPYLSFAYPHMEAPFSYFRKLTLGDPVTAFAHLKKGEKVQLKYLLMTFPAQDYADYMRQIWTRSYDQFQPQVVKGNKLSDDEIKKVLTRFYTQSFVQAGDLKGFSGIHLQTHVCEVREILEVGFIGRVLLNAFNALEYAHQHGDKELEKIARAVFDSYESHGFSESGFFREVVDTENNYEQEFFSIRRQSEGIYAMLLYLDHEKRNGRTHGGWDKRIRGLLDKLLTLQREDGSYPRKFEGDLELVDATGGSSPSAVLPLAMAYRYFGDNKYLNSARKVIDYEEKEIISKSDYFSSTLDADCEDKEASLYAATALYYMAMVTKGKERQRYVDLAQQAAYFTLSWYYTWDVPFDQGQMLGELGLKSRGWGNVSVENNHIDVFIFEFDEVLKWLAAEKNEKRFSDFADVIRSSMREQLLPYEGHMAGIGKEGYYPEVVQHTAWDYGHFGKGFYNLHFAPGWTVASIWELLTDGRAKEYLTRNR